jgi:hypothetical protein
MQMSAEINENGGYYFNLQAGIVFFESSAGFVSWKRSVQLWTVGSSLGVPGKSARSCK